MEDDLRDQYEDYQMHLLLSEMGFVGKIIVICHRRTQDEYQSDVEGKRMNSMACLI